MDNRSLFFKEPTKGVGSFTAGRTLFVVYSSPLRRKSFTLKLSCCHILEPLLCMSRITLIHCDQWLLHHLPRRAPRGAAVHCLQSVRGERREKVSMQEVLHQVVGQWRSRFGYLALSWVLCHAAIQAKCE